MPHLTRRAGRHGVTLIELLVGLALFAVVGAALLQVFVFNQRAATAQAQRVDALQSVRTAAAILPAELRELDAADGDIIAMSATSLTIRAMRQLAFICNPPVMGGVLTGRTLTIRRPVYSGQAFAVGDSLLVWDEGDTYVRTDDGWIRGRITAASNLNCPDGNPGTQLTVDFVSPIPAPMVNTAGAVPAGAPVRGYVTVTYSVAQAADNRYYLYLQTPSGTQPLLGPLTGASGVAFSYYDANGNVTATRTSVAQVRLVLRSQSTGRARTAGGYGYLTDSLSTVITLRNNPRF